MNSLFHHPDLQKMIDVLQQYGTGQCQNLISAIGICNNLNVLQPDIAVYDFVCELMQQHPDFSGMRNYPVKSYMANYDAKGAYTYSENKWRNDAYGDARRDMCLFLAKRLQHYIDCSYHI